jgi:hypothetical protein
VVTVSFHSEPGRPRKESPAGKVRLDWLMFVMVVFLYGQSAECQPRPPDEPVGKVLQEPLLAFGPDDGINCAYLFASCHGLELAYSDFVTRYSPADGRKLDITDIQSLLRSFTIETRIVELPGGDVTKLIPPAMLALGDGEVSRFYIMVGYNADSSRFDLVDGNTGEYVKMLERDVVPKVRGKALVRSTPLFIALLHLLHWVVILLVAAEAVLLVAIGLLALRRRIFADSTRMPAATGTTGGPS